MKTQTTFATLKLAAGVVSAVVMLGVSGCTSDRPQGGQNTSVPGDDQAIVRQVQDGFRTNPDYPYAGVRVASTNGDVQLTGYVQSVWQKYGAAAIASRVPGVKGVHNQIVAENDNAPTTAASGVHE